MPVRVTVVVCTRGHGVSEFHARDACLAEIVRLLQERSVAGSRSPGNTYCDDQRTIRKSWLSQ